jgi:hypothetical protein
MKIPKFVWSVFVAFVAVGLVAPQQAEATFIDMLGSGTSGPQNAEGKTTFVPGTFGTFTAGGNFEWLSGPGVTLTFKQITWTGSGLSAKLASGPIIGEWVATNTTGLVARFDLNNLTPLFRSAIGTVATETSFVLQGKGTLTLTGGLHTFVTPAEFSILQLGPVDEDFVYNGLEADTVTTPDGGSALGLLALGLVAVEGLRRKLATRQNRYA